VENIIGENTKTDNSARDKKIIQFFGTDIEANKKKT